MTNQYPYYALEDLTHVDGHPYGVDSGHANTISINGVTYVVLADILNLYGEEEEIKRITRGVRHPGVRTVLVDVHQVPHPRQVVPLSRLHHVMLAVRARLDALDEEEEAEDNSESEEEASNSEDEEYVVDDDASIEVESGTEEEEATASSSSEDSESDEIRPSNKRSAGALSGRPQKYSKH